MSSTPSWWQNRPLRARIAAAVALTVAVATGAALVVGYVAVRRELLGQIDDQLRQQARQLQEQAAFSRGRGVPDIRLRVEFGQTGGYVQVVNPLGQATRPPGQSVALPVDEDDVGVASAQRRAYIRDATVGGTRVRLLTGPLTEGYAVQVALPRDPVDDQLGRLALAFVLLALIALGVTVGLAWLLTRTALTPVAQLTETAERIARTKDLTHRINEARDDEVGRLAASFNSMLDALHRSLGAQRQLVLDASHELRTPLASLRTNTEVLRQFDAMTPQQREETVAGIVGQLEELTTLVGDVVELARGEEPAQELTDVALDELVETAVLQAQRHWPAVVFALDAEPVTVHGVPRRLERAVANLLDNAAKFSPPGGTVAVALTGDGSLVVRDQGPGISPTALPQVFERFYRADEARSMPGSGLGLAIVKQVVESHRGTISVDNAADGGLVARLQLPPA